MNADLNIFIVLGKDNEANGKLKYGVVSAVTGTIMCYERKDTQLSLEQEFIHRGIENRLLS